MKTQRPETDYRPTISYHLNAFGLPEILIILAVIIALALLAIPFFSGKRDRQAQIASIDNLRKWGMALNLSLPDVNNQLPWKGDPIEKAQSDPRFNYAWYILLPPYISTPAWDEIPEDQRPRLGQPSLWINPAVTKRDLPRGSQHVFHYAMNAYLGSGKELLRITRVENPAATVFMGETLGESASLRPDNVVSLFGDSDVARPRTDPRGQANFLFCDGRVAAVTRRVFAAKDDDGNYLAETRLDDRFTFLPYEGAKPF